MRRHRVQVAAAVIVSAGALLLAGCGSNDPGAIGLAESGSPVASAEAEPAAEAAEASEAAPASDVPATEAGCVLLTDTGVEPQSIDFGAGKVLPEGQMVLFATEDCSGPAEATVLPLVYAADSDEAAGLCTGIAPGSSPVSNADAEDLASTMAEANGVDAAEAAGTTYNDPFVYACVTAQAE